jgi:hypothetical protein
VSDPQADDPQADNREYARQEQIWAAMYGPAGAADLLEKARVHRASHPDMAIREIFREVEPSDDDSDEAGLSRPGVG